MFFIASIIFLIFLVFLALYGQTVLNRTMDEYRNIPSEKGMTGAELARKILDEQQLYDVRVEKVSGYMTDCYDSIHRNVKLSRLSYEQPSVIATAVAIKQVAVALESKSETRGQQILEQGERITVFFTKVLCPLLLVSLIINSLFFRITVALYLAVVIFHLVYYIRQKSSQKLALELLQSQGISQREQETVKEILEGFSLIGFSSMLGPFSDLLRLAYLTDKKRKPKWKGKNTIEKI